MAPELDKLSLPAVLGLSELTLGQFRKALDDPAFLTSAWRDLILTLERSLGPLGEVRECDWSAEEISRPMIDISGKSVPGMMLYLPPDLVLPHQRQKDFLGKFLEVKASSETETHNTSGWLKVYWSLRAPNPSVAWSEAGKFAEEHGYLPGRERTYILASLISKAVTGHAFDEPGLIHQSISGLPGSVRDGVMVFARSNRHGAASSIWCPPETAEVAAGLVGWRFEEVKK